MRRVVFLILFCVLSGGCSLEKRRLADDVESLMKQTINIPTDLCCVYDRCVTSEVVEERKDNILIVYMDSSVCYSCKIMRFRELYPLYTLADKSGEFSVMTIMSPKIDEMNSVLDNIMISNPRFPIYLDVKGSFRKINHIPSNKDCHVFLIDENRKPIFVGNPLMSPELEKLFWRVLMGKTEE